MHRTMFAAAAGLAIAIAAPVLAQGTQGVVAAQQAGLVGERFDGYLGYVTTPSPALRRQVDAVNIRRRTLFANLAGRRGATQQEVGITAACTLLGRVAVGQAYMLGDGAWRRRAAGQAAPVPDYCGGAGQ